MYVPFAMSASSLSKLVLAFKVWMKRNDGKQINWMTILKLALNRQGTIVGTVMKNFNDFSKYVKENFAGV